MVDKQKKIWLDGEFIDWDAAQVHVLTHTLHYGLAAFDGMRAYQRSDGGTYIFRLREHVDRLFDTCKMCLLQPKFTRDQIERVDADAKLECVVALDDRRDLVAQKLRDRLDQFGGCRFVLHLNSSFPSRTRRQQPQQINLGFR